MSADTFDELKPMMEGIAPVQMTERKNRVEMAQRLMAENRIDAILLEPGASFFYFTGISWSRSERMMAALLPANGELAYVCPEFEETRLREMISCATDVRVWQEHENPHRRAAEILADFGVAQDRIGVEESVRFFLFDGLRRELPKVELVSAEPVIVPCRAVKSQTEIALIQRAMDITVEAYRATLLRLKEGMTPEEFQAISVAAHRALGVSGGIECQFGSSTAYPHGSREPSCLREGDVVLMDGGCTVEGYHSDISRTIVFGTPTQRHRQVWDLEKRAQEAAFAAAQIGVPFEEIDAAARRVITDAGYGPGYKVPGLPHRAGHGIGLEIHEPYNVVQGNLTPLAPGMCFSNEPMIAIYGEFGVRLEDCLYITPDGPRYFTQPSPSIEEPFA